MRETRWVRWVRWVRWIERRVGRAALLGEDDRRRQGLVVLVVLVVVGVVVVAGVVEFVLADVVPKVPGILGLGCRSIRRSGFGFGAAELDGRHGRCERVLDLVLVRVRGLVLRLRLRLRLRRVRIGWRWIRGGIGIGICICILVRLMILSSVRLVKGSKGLLLLMQMVRAHREGGGRVDERGHVVCRYSSTLVFMRDEEVESQAHRHRLCQCPHRPPHVLLTPVHLFLHDFESERPASPRASQTVILMILMILMKRLRARVRVFVYFRKPECLQVQVRVYVHVVGGWRTRARAWWWRQRRMRWNVDLVRCWWELCLRVRVSTCRSSRNTRAPGCQ